MEDDGVWLHVWILYIQTKYSICSKYLLQNLLTILAVARHTHSKVYMFDGFMLCACLEQTFSFLHCRTKNWFNNFSQQFDKRLLQSAKTSAENKRRLLQHMPRAAQPCLADIRFCKALAKCTPDIEKGCERLQGRAQDQHGGVSAAVAVNSCGGW